ncbi:conserved hypothetical protein [Pediculus humanus corporis]|uniref:G protein pathway suppressor 2 n=1 Tax=Pediculus humanus subsp. corporis TaxID=121224 RepID=E0VPM0_PEDHC|nr:uncharacterized protein Phum_PHUM361670 [Pediculus humanus corporis]EEB15326.1 conserved hypothetical protein [Pediculus humanus corporis]
MCIEKAMMPATVPGRQCSEAEWQALKNHIIKERQRKKQEQEADAEVQRQKREREQKQKQDVMTLGETREQISTLEARLAALTEEKHQLFLQLKKVLNEDDNRRRQAVVKESANEMIGVGGTYGNLAPPGIFLQPLPGRTPLYKVGAGAPTNTGPPVPSKRARSPSPPASQGPGYHPYSYKSSPGFQHKPEDGRRGHEYVRAVLWNKGTAATYGGVYGVAPTQSVYSYSAAPTPYEQVYLPRQSYDSKPESDKIYLRGPTAPLSIPVHPPQPGKPGGITTGFPVRAPHQSHSVYLGQGSGNNSRLMYGGTPAGNPGNRYAGSGTM